MPKPRDDEPHVPTRRRNLLVVRAGDESLHPGWLTGTGERNFDLLVSYFGEQEGRYREQADIYHAMRGPRWPAHDAICREDYARIGGYDHVGFACDDLRAALPTWNALFSICRSFKLDLAQPAIEGHVSFPITQPVEGCLLRYTNFVETMCPVFSRAALGALHPSFGESVSGWGLNHLWPTLLAGGRMAIIDSVRVSHVRPLWIGPLYKRLAEQKVDPRAELAAVLKRHGLKMTRPRETGRVSVLPEPGGAAPALPAGLRPPQGDPS